MSRTDPIPRTGRRRRFSPETGGPRRALAVGLALLLIAPPAAAPSFAAVPPEKPPSHEPAPDGSAPGESGPEEPLAAPAPAIPPSADAPSVDDPSAEDPPVEPDDPFDLAPRHREWLEAGEPLITRDERLAFLRLTRDYQRDAFVDRFWRMRDPYPETARNELKERFERMIELVRTVYGTYQDDRARVLLVHGRPQGGFQVRCTKSHIPAEVWAYERTDVVDFSFLLVFLKRRFDAPARVWRPGEGFRLDQSLEIARGCLNSEQLLTTLNSIQGDAANYQRQLARVLAKPRPRSEEWLDTFAAYSTDVDPRAPDLTADLSFGFPGRHDNRTVVQGVVSVPRGAVSVGEFAGYRSADFLLVGEVVADDRLFENFRYKFGFPAHDLPAGRVPLAFQRYLRPGDYTLILKLEDLNGDAVARFEREVTVPRVDEVLPQPKSHDPETAELFAEATAAIAAGETSLRIVPPPGTIQTGLVRIDTLAVGPEIERVAFFLDDRPVMIKNRPPFNVELDLGELPQAHTVRAVARDAEGRDVARDEYRINAGGNRFAVRLVEPRRGRSYERSLRARAEVDVPQGRTVERVELFLNERPVATLYQPPWVQPVTLPEEDGDELTYVRAVAYLADGNATEDLVFINAPENLEEVDVQFVELYTSALDGSGRPVTGLERSDFRVFEDGVEQSIARFDRVRDLPVHAGVLIDNSGSMSESLESARQAALTFFRQAVTPRDRAALITFNKFPLLAVKLTNNLQTLGGGLAGLTAEGETALYDSLIFGLYYFAGIKGQRALLVLSDGKDESSRFSYTEALEYARRAGVTVYAIGLGLREPDARRKLAAIAEETGGRSFFVPDATELESIYTSIEQELRSQYLIAYQSTNTGDDRDFREVELRVDRPGVKLQTISGYYP